ncbi:MAG TPA: VOC family protein [Candidatus Fimivivens faecavium]|nr:VOC family protein [Candidatus Fimivivens faecavium]
MADKIRLADVVVDCPDEEKLCAFYEGLLGWKRSELFGHPAVVSENGVMFAFVKDDFQYEPPVWPEAPGKPQKQLHFDFLVPDVAAAVEKAESLGAKKADAQYGGDNFTTMIDPAGHPFCLCKAN